MSRYDMGLKNLVKLKASGTEEASDTEDDGVIIKTSGRCTNIMSYEERKKRLNQKVKISGDLYCY